MFRLRTLGVVDLRRAEGDELRAVLAQPKRTALLAYLALATPRGFQRRDRIMALFWPEQDVEHARNALNQAIFFLRRHLGADTILARNSEEVRLNPEFLWCDAVAFEELATEGRYAEAVDLYRGELLASFHVPDAAAELERWVDGERRRLSDQYALALERLASEHEMVGDSRSAAIWWRRLAAHDPYNGRVALRLMRALAAGGDRAAALDHARIHQTMVREEMSLEPDRDITSFVRQLQESPPAVESSPPPKSKPAAIVVSELRAPAPRIDVPFRSRRALILSLVVFLVLVGSAGTALYRARAGRADPVIGSVAVLPFVNLTGDSSMAYLADVVTEVVTTELARCAGLQITSRTSAERFKGTKRPLGEIAHALHVVAILEGSLARDGRLYQVTVQLIDAPNDVHLWGDTYQRDSANVLAIVDDIAGAIVREVHLRTVPACEQRAAKKPASAAAYAVYLRGQSTMLSRTPEAMRLASIYFRQSLVLDSTFALGYAGLAEVFHIAGNDGYLSWRVAVDSAHHLAARAVGLDTGLSEGHTALAAVLADEAQWASAEREFRTAIALSPSNALARHWYAQFLAVLGRLDEALQQINVGRDLDPISGSLSSTAAAIEVAAGISKPSTRPELEAVTRDPVHAWRRAGYARALAREGKCAEARVNIDSAKVLIPDNIRMLAQVFAVEWRCGDRTKAMALLDEMKHRPDARAKGLWIASIYNAWNQRDSAFVWLDSIEWTGDMRFNFLVAPAWDSARTDSRYPRIVRQIGLR